MTVLNTKRVRYEFRIKDRWSTITHFAGFLASIAAMPVLLIHGMRNGADTAGLTACAVFMLGMILLYGASASYHAFDSTPAVNDFLKKLDHMSIFILIASSYTPVCVMRLGREGVILLITVWTIAALGMIFKFFHTYCPRWVSSVLYTAMGWACIFVLPLIVKRAGTGAFLWLLAGGIFYSAGAVIYACRRPLTQDPEFGNHEIFHCFVLAGSLCHYLSVFLCLL